MRKKSLMQNLPPTEYHYYNAKNFWRCDTGGGAKNKIYNAKEIFDTKPPQPKIIFIVRKLPPPSENHNYNAKKFWSRDTGGNQK